MGRLSVVVAGWLILSAPFQAQQQSGKKEADKDETFVYTNADMPSAYPSSTTLPRNAPPTALKLPSGSSYAGVRDRSGHGEGWWRQRAAEMDARVLAARIEAEQLHVDYVKGKTITDPSLGARSRDATKALLKLEAERDRLPEEMRRAGGLPGWLRRGGTSLPSELLPSPVPFEASYSDELLLSWEAVRQAGFYIVEAQCLDCCGLLAPCDVESLDVSTTSAGFPFAPGSSVTWRVRALDAAGFAGEWSEWTSFLPRPVDP